MITNEHIVKLVLVHEDTVTYISVNKATSNPPQSKEIFYGSVNVETEDTISKSFDTLTEAMLWAKERYDECFNKLIKVD